MPWLWQAFDGWPTILFLIQINSYFRQVGNLRAQYPNLLSTRAQAQTRKKESNMAENDDVPLMQKVLDNPFLLLFLGVATPGLLYIVWGLIDIMSVPLAK
jgi:hypothetical protein